jgi:hypothetical protein
MPTKKDAGMYGSQFDTWTERQLEEAAADVLEDYDAWEIWNAPGVHDAVLQYFHADSVDDDPRGVAFSWLEPDELLRIPGVRDACLSDIIAGGAAADRCEQWLRWEERRAEEMDRESAAWEAERGGYDD